MTCVLLRRGNLDKGKKGQPLEDTEWRWPTASQGEWPEKKPNLPVPWSCTSHLQNGEKINFYCLSHSVCGVCYSIPNKLVHLPSRFVQITAGYYTQ